MVHFEFERHTQLKYDAHHRYRQEAGSGSDPEAAATDEVAGRASAAGGSVAALPTYCTDVTGRGDSRSPSRPTAPRCTAR